MSYSLVYTHNFAKEAKRLSKKHASFKRDLTTVVETLTEDPYQGTRIGELAYKLRFAIKSKGKGKSGGARLIFVVRVLPPTEMNGEGRVHLLSVYDKSDTDNISEVFIASELKRILEEE